MATVYIWPSRDQIGHASVEIENDYLSFHPVDRRWIQDLDGTRARLARDYHEDSEGAGSGPKSTIDIDWLDESAMRDRITQIDRDIGSEKLLYKFLTTNCSAMTADVLFEGAGSDFNPHRTLRGLWVEMRAKFSRGPWFHHDHETIEDGIREIIEDSLIRCRRRGGINRISTLLTPVLLASDLLSREFSWTPGNVKSLAEQLANHNHR